MDDQKTAPSADGVVLSLSVLDLAIWAFSACIEFGLVDGQESLRARDELLNLRMIATESSRVTLAVRA